VLRISDGVALSKLPPVLVPKPMHWPIFRPTERLLSSIFSLW